MKNEAELIALARQLTGLTSSQIYWVEAVIKQFTLPYRCNINPESKLINQAVSENLGDALRIHHAFSRQALSKDRFEFALERSFNLSGIAAELAKRTNRGHDITIGTERFSLKTQADAAIKRDVLHISKFMELGSGEWVLSTLRNLFLSHMSGYERILQFRCLTQANGIYEYELVEIPKYLLLEAIGARLVISEDSKQDPKPGYGYVMDVHGQSKFNLYFDGGSERKLQIKALRKNLCTVHATWEFTSNTLA